jgi:hypothetical protein
LAKVNAEMAPGVGDATDLAIVTKAGTEFLTDAFLERLDALREELNGQQPSDAQVDELFAKRKEA